MPIPQDLMQLLGPLVPVPDPNAVAPVAPAVGNPLPDWASPLMSASPTAADGPVPSAETTVATPLQSNLPGAAPMQPGADLPFLPQLASGPTEPAGPPSPNELRSQKLTGALSGVQSVDKTKNSRQGFAKQQQLAEIGVASASEAADLTRQANAKVGEQAAEADRLAADAVKQNVEGAQMARQQAQQRAAVKLAEAEKRADDIARSEPNPGRLWSNMSGWGKAAYFLGTLAYSLASNRLQPTAINPMITNFRRMVEQDIDSQKDKNTKLLANEGVKRQNILDARKEGMDEAATRYTEYATRIASADKYLQSLAKNAGGDERRLAGIAATRAELAKVNQEIVKEYSGVLATRENKAADFAHAERMAKLSFENSTKLKQMEMDQEKEKDLETVSPELGLSIIVDRVKDGPNKGNPIVAPQTRLSRAYVLKATETVAEATKMRQALQRVVRKIETKTNTDVLLKRDPEYNQDLQLIARYQATQPSFNRGATTGPDVVQSGDTIQGRITGGVLEALSTLGSRRDMAAGALKHYLKNQSELVNGQLKQFPTPEGGSLHWTPQESPSELPEGDKYLVPGEKERRLAMTTDSDAGIPLTTPKAPALLAAGFGPENRTQAILPGEQPSMELGPQALEKRHGEAPTKLKAMTSEEISTAQRVEADTENMTVRGELDIMRAKLKSEDAQQRYLMANKGRLEAKADKEEKIAEELVFSTGLNTNPSGPPPANADIRRIMEAAKIPAGGLIPADYDHIRALVEDKAREVQERRKNANPNDSYDYITY